MKTWLFAILESTIAIGGLAAWLWADNVLLAGAAAMTAAALGVAQPIMAARQAGRIARYQDEMFDASVESVDQEIAKLLDEVTFVPLPHRPTVAAVLHKAFPEEAESLIKQYDRLVKAAIDESFAAEELAAAFADKIDDHPLALHMCGLAAMSQENLEEAHEYFLTVTERRPEWISPWLGWAATAWRLEQVEEISARHPHVNGVNLTPYDVGDEQTFIDLAEDERDALVEEFQQTARALGNFYTMAEYSKSKRQIESSREQFRRAA